MVIFYNASLYFYCKLREAKTTMMNTGIHGKTAKDKKIAASIRGLKMGRVLQDVGNFAKEIETSLVNGDSKTELKRKIKVMQNATVLAAREVTCAARNSSVISGSALVYTVNRTGAAAERRRLDATCCCNSWE